MAVAFDASAHVHGSDTTKTVALTVGAGADRVVCVSIIWASITVTVDSVTYNAVALTSLGAAQIGGATRSVQFFGSTDHEPASGTANVVVTFSGSVAAEVSAAAYTGVDQTTRFDTPVTATGFSTAPLATVTTQTDDSYIQDAATDTGSTTWTGGADQTVIHGHNNSVSSGASYQDGAAGGAMSWTIGSAADWRASAVNIRPAAAAGGTILPMMMAHEAA